MSYEVYKADAQDAFNWQLPHTSLMESAARNGARRVAWAVAEWYRKDNGLEAFLGQLPESLQRVLEEEAPD